MKYFLILGTNPSLSLSEIDFYFKSRKITFNLEVINNEVVFLETKTELNVGKIIKELGGTIKIGIIKVETKKINLDSFIEVLGDGLENIDYKFKFGFSTYSSDILPLNKIAMSFKNKFKKDGISCRWVISKEKALSSVVVEQNKLVNKGADFVITRRGQIFYIGKTLAVQDFKGLARRDFGRPARDDESGMLPPKLAQIMINISGVRNEQVLLDPFCGSGTVLTEAIAMGIKNIFGSDLSKKAVEDSRKNTNWLLRGIEDKPSVDIEQIDSTKVSLKIDRDFVDAIVTEPYLGPQRGAHDIKKTVQTLEDLYSNSLEEFSKVLKKDSSVVMVWPVFVSRDGQKKKYFLDNIKTSKFNVIPLLEKKYLENDFIKTSKRGGIIYGRPGQKIWREIVLLKLK